MRDGTLDTKRVIDSQFRNIQFIQDSHPIIITFRIRIPKKKVEKHKTSDDRGIGKFPSSHRREAHVDKKRTRIKKT